MAGMSEVATAQTSVPPHEVWTVLADIAAWPTWSPTIEQVRTEPAEADDVGEHPAYRIEQPPLPTALWTITDWRPEQGFAWQTRGASTLLAGSYAMRHIRPGTEVVMSLTWTGTTAWLVRAAYGPVSIRYAESHLAALVQRCEAAN